jgi:hypothetical protein
MLPILFVETVYAAPGDDCDDYCPEPAESDTDTLFMGFRELVRAIQHGGYSHASASHRTARDVTAWDWLSADSEQDYRTGDVTERSIHLEASATPHQVRYWRLAWKAAGIVKA